MRNMQPFSDVVLLAIKTALAPLQAQLAAADERNKDLQARLDDLSGLRDRVTTVETKIAQPLAPAPPVDLSPVLERVAAAEARISTLSEQGRTVNIELDGKKLTESALHKVDIPSGPSAADLELSMRDKLDPLTKEIGALRERVVAVEVRTPTPGPAGSPGQDGKDGINGKDGSDGLGWDDLVVEHDGERTFTIKMVRGDRVKDAGSFVVPLDIYRGVFVEGKSYDRGDGVTWGGSEWHCHEPTTAKPGDGSKAWTLKVKRGRDGRDGKDAPSVPVVKVS